MKLQKVSRIATCAIIISMCLAGVGLFPVQSAAGHVTRALSLHDAAAMKQLKQGGQFDAVESAINRERRSVSHIDNTPLGRSAWHAPNPEAGYDAYVTEAGVSIALDNESYVSLSLHSLGYGSALRAISPGQASGDKQMINLVREGGVREWYINGPEGLEQGFTLMEPPGPQQPGAPMRLALEVSKGWRAVANEGGKSVMLRGPNGEAVEYGKLAVHDDRGRDLPAQLTVRDEEVVIEVADGEASYPVTIDPTFNLQKKVLAPDGALQDGFGLATAISGDTLVVGAYSDDMFSNPDQGSAYVFTRNGTAWAFQQKLTANDGSSGDQFGSKVAISGDTIVVGAGGDDIGSSLDQGSAYVFTRSGAVWTFQQKLWASDGAADQYFGTALDISGDTIVAGVANADIGTHPWQGSAYVFTRSGTVWSFAQKLTASDGASDDFFGVDVSISGDTLAIGAFRDFVTHVDQGSVYIFTRSNGSWSQQQRLFASDGEESDLFGNSVALSDDTLVVGSIDDDIGWLKQGSAYVFIRKGPTWMFQQKLTASDAGTHDGFGVSVAISDDTIVVGADDDIGANTDQGSAYIFTRSGGYWSEQQKLTANDGSAGDLFGISVAISGDTVVAGAFGDDIGTNENQGSAYVFLRPTCYPLFFSPTILNSGHPFVPYQQPLSIINSSGPLQFYVSSGTLPPGISLSSSGVLSGSPQTLGSYPVTIGVTDMSTGCFGTRAYTLSIVPCYSITLDPADNPTGAVGSEYYHTLASQGGREPYRYIAKGKLPPGLTLSLAGVFSGTPTQVGYFPFLLVIVDANGCSASWSVYITITHEEVFSVASPAGTIAPKAPMRRKH